MWLLLVIQLAFQPEPHVVHGEVAEILSSEKKCEAKIDEIMKEAKKRGKPIPDNYNLGCVPLNGSKV